MGIIVPASRTLLDLSRPEGLSRALDDLASELIINPAAYAAVDKAEDERELAFRVNAEGRARWRAGRQRAAYP